MPSIDSRKIEAVLEKVTKPGRYTGNEWNSIKKDFDTAAVKVALCFPDLYEIGMSHLGFKILYHLLNEQPDVACERFFAAWPDMQEVLKQEGLPLFSLESKRPLTDFDVIGFSLQYELNYTNVLAMLAASGMPLKASERGDNSPIVIAGGAGVFNPEPMAEFFDAFFIGEAEEAVLEIIEVVRRHCEGARRGESAAKRSLPEGDEAISGLGDCFASLRSARNDVLKELAGIEGVYVPSFYEVEYDEDGTIKKFTPKEDSAPAVIKKRIVKDFENAYYPTKQIVPYIQIVHDRISLEIMRGCPNRCRFCQAVSVYWPCRQRSLEKILQIAEEAYDATGYEEISLVSLSTGDHAQIAQIVQNLVGRFKSRNVSISLPSLRAEDMFYGLPQLISSIKKTGLTFAPEAGSQRLRDAINKRVDMEKLYKCITEAAKNGWRHIKLYFMLGLPTETEEDLSAIAGLVSKISKADPSINKPFISVNVSVSFFVPKPHTAFEYEPMADMDTIKKSRDFLQKTLKGKGIVLRWHDPQVSFLEGVFSRGDRRLSAVVLKAYELGARFDGWREHFNFGLWQRAFDSTGMDPAFYLYRQRKEDEILPWSHIDCGLPFRHTCNSSATHY